MYINGSLSFNVPADPPAISGGTSTGGTASGGTTTGGTSTGGTTTSGNPLTLVVTGDNMAGTDPQIEVFVDGQQVGNSTYTITADHALGQTQTITINGNFDPMAAHQVQIQFINDNWDGQLGDGHDINAYVESISLNGTTIVGAHGTNNAMAGGAQPSNPNEAVMYVNGSLNFNVPADPPAGTVTGGTLNTGSGGSGTSGGGTIDVGTGAGAPPSGPGFFVSPNGNDSNPGTLDAPFATLARAQQAMENSSIKTTYIEGGTYNVTSSLTLTSADNGETWSYYAPNGVDSAVIDGGNTVDPIAIAGASNITIDGLKIQHVYDTAIYTPAGFGQSSNIIIENNDIGFNQHTGFAGGFNPLIALGNVTHAQVLNNYVHDGASQGIALYAFNSGESVDGSVVSGNVVLRTVEQQNDGGAIYVDMRYTNVNGGHVTISNNFVEDFGGSAVNSAVGIYLDDDSSNVTVSGNIIGPGAVGTASPIATIVNGGIGNVFTDNIVDLGHSGNGLVAGWTEPGGGGSVPFNWTAPNVFQDNVVISDYAGPTQTYLSGITGQEYVQGPGYPTAFGVVADNVYFNYGGGAATTTGNIVSDSAPIFENPQLSGATYTVAAGSPISSSINFSPIVGGWGPQGFVIQHSPEQSI
jgi:hypothetical protein